MVWRNGPVVVQGLYWCIKPLESKSAALQWVQLGVSPNKTLHGWAWTLDTYRPWTIAVCALVRFALHMCTNFRLNPEQVNDARSISTRKNSIYTLLTITKPIIYCCRVIIVVSLKYLLKGRIKPQTSLSIYCIRRDILSSQNIASGSNGLN